MYCKTGRNRKQNRTSCPSGIRILQRWQKKFKSKVYIQNMDEEGSCKANAKSIIMLITQSLCSGSNG
ncbi:MAG: HPr family phosphocarrier protein [Coprococcus sp.]